MTFREIMSPHSMQTLLGENIYIDLPQKSTMHLHRFWLSYGHYLTSTICGTGDNNTHCNMAIFQHFKY